MERSRLVIAGRRGRDADPDGRGDLRDASIRRRSVIVVDPPPTGCWSLNAGRGTREQRASEPLDV